MAYFACLGSHPSDGACLEHRWGLLAAAGALQQDLAPVLALRRVVLGLPDALLLLVLPLVALHLLTVVLVVHFKGQPGSVSGRERPPRQTTARGQAGPLLHIAPCQDFCGRMLRPPCPPIGHGTELS